MKVRRVFHPEPVSIEAWEGLRAAARLMHDHGVSCLPVMSDVDLIGIITERDLVEAMAVDELPQRARVFEHMTQRPQTVDLDADCAEAVTEMLALGCRHLPVIDQGRVIGVVSARDLLPLATAGAVEG